MRCVLFFCLSVVLGLAAGYPQRNAPQYELPYHLAASYNPFLSAAALPARRHRDLVDESADSDSFGQRGFARPEFGLSDFDTPYSPSFTDMMSQMQEMMVRLRQEMNEILHRLPARGSDGEGALVPFGGDGIDLSDAQNKSTSRTEIIDGQKVTINETVIRSGDKDVGTIFRVKTIRVIPHDDVIPDVEHDETTTIKDLTEESDEEVAAPSTRNAKNNDNNEIPNEKVGIEVEDLNKA